MKTYDFLQIDNTELKYKYIIYSISFDTPLTHLDEISMELSKKNIGNCKVLFDLLLSVGNASDRFVEAKFDGASFINTSFTAVNLKKKSIFRDISNKYFNENLHLLEDSVLNSYQKKLITKGIVI